MGLKLGGVVEDLQARGYAIHTFARNALSRSLTVAEAVSIASARRYVDFLLCEPTSTSLKLVRHAGFSVAVA